MSEILVELTPEAVAQARHWILLLAADRTAPDWNPVDDYDTPERLRAAARWLVDNGHSGAMDDDLVGLLLVIFSMTFRREMSIADAA